MIIKALVSILVLGVLIFVHELGHFLIAKLCRVGVIEFAIGFGPKIFSFKFGKTKYSLRAIPLGGFVRMVGDDPRLASPSDVTEHLSVESETDAKMDPDEKAMLADRSLWFLDKGYFAKVAVVLAGPLFNLIFAVLASITVVYLYGVGEPQDKPIVGSVIPDSAAEKAGVREGDVVYEINGKSISDWSALHDIISASNGDPLEVKIRRDPDQILSLIIQPKEIEKEMALLEGREVKEGEKIFRIGIGASSIMKEVSFLEASYIGFIHTYHWTKMTVKSIGALAQRQISHKNISGPIFIFQQAADTASKGADRVLNFMVFLSISLAVLNLMPIPILDGGHILFFTIEAIKGSRLSLKFYERAQQLGMVLLLSLMVIAFSNDLTRLFG